MTQLCTHWDWLLECCTLSLHKARQHTTAITWFKAVHWAPSTLASCACAECAQYLLCFSQCSWCRARARLSRQCSAHSLVVELVCAALSCQSNVTEQCRSELKQWLHPKLWQLFYLELKYQCCNSKLQGKYWQERTMTRFKQVTNSPNIWLSMNDVNCLDLNDNPHL